MKKVVSETSGAVFSLPWFVAKDEGFFAEEGIDIEFDSTNSIHVEQLATDPEKTKLKNGKERLNIPHISKDDIQFLEQAIDRMDAKLEPMTHFILPGGHTTVSYCHIARSVCRRAERNCVSLSENEPVEEEIIQYLNRLSDYLFVLARMLTKTLQVKEVKWIPRKGD